MLNKEMQDLKVQQEDWMVKRWRPMMGWTYMATCIFDFILGPILFNLLQYYNLGQAVGMWTPLTLQGGGMYHVAMGAILGISAWSRGQEKMSGVNTPLVSQEPVMMNSPNSQSNSNYQKSSYRPEQTYSSYEDYSDSQEATLNVSLNTSDTITRPKRKKFNI
jgi:hypothetical protein